MPGIKYATDNYCFTNRGINGGAGKLAERRRADYEREAITSAAAIDAGNDKQL